MIEYFVSCVGWLLLLLLVAAGAFVNSCLSYFLSFCFDEGNIFQNYLPWLNRNLPGGEKNFWFNPLGGCAVCSNIWQGLITFWIFKAVTHIHVGLFPLIFIYISYLLLSNLFIRKMI